MLNVMKVLREAIEAEYNKLLAVPYDYLSDEGEEMKSVLCDLSYVCDKYWLDEALECSVFSDSNIKFKEARIMIARVKGMLMAMAEQERLTRNKIDREGFEAFLKEQGDSDEDIKKVLGRFDREENHD